MKVTVANFKREISEAKMVLTKFSNGRMSMREVESIGPHGVWFHSSANGRSYLQWPKRSELDRDEEGTWLIFDEHDPYVRMTYTIVK